MRRPTVRESDAWKLLSLTSRGHLLVRLERVWWMTGNTGFAFHEWIGLQLCHLLGVTSLAYAHRRLGREALCHVAMAGGAIDLVDVLIPQSGQRTRYTSITTVARYSDHGRSRTSRS